MTHTENAANPTSSSRAARTDGARHADALAASTLTELLRLMGAEAIDNALGDAYPVAMRRVRAGATLYHEGTQAESIYFVNIGSFKSIRTAEDGYEQVLGFVRRGELLGFDAVCMGQHPTAAIALEDSRVFAVRIQDIFTLAQRAPALDRVLHLAVSRQLTARADIADVMAAVAADVRLARFLVQMSERMQACGQSPRRLYLRMSRSDIASYLGVAHATVSRSFSALAAWGCQWTACTPSGKARPWRRSPSRTPLTGASTVSTRASKPAASTWAISARKASRSCMA